MIASTPARVGTEHTSNAIGFQIAAAVLGQSLVPAVIGLMARRVGLEFVGAGLLVSAVTVASLHILLVTYASRATQELSAPV